MSQVIAFEQVARLAAPGDNVAIATRRLEAGTVISYLGQQLSLNATVLEGHRFAIQAIDKGAEVLSWGLPFAVAIRGIAAGNYIANQSIIDTLSSRRIDVSLPAEGNIADVILDYQLDEASFQAAEQVPPFEQGRSFAGYDRGQRGAGTRNMIVLLGTSSLTASYVSSLEQRFKGGRLASYSNIDGVVAVAHTEGGTSGHANNLELVLRTLAGFMVHPNVAAVLAVDIASDGLNNQLLARYCADHHYPIAEVPHHFISLEAELAAELGRGEALVEAWLEQVNAQQRTEVPLAALKLALQCGGSDAFSGISGNPLVGSVAKDLIRYGGTANLAETDELIGAEPYVLKRVKDLKVARQFLATIKRFQARASWHGSSAEGNPSGGNKLRGLYNIVLKSIGAANKKDPEVRLDAVIDYGEIMHQPGFYFMDSPGNDLESIAGQVAAGCNMIFFVTGNGSITNFPFVPTIKVVTTSERYQLLKDDMDVNAGAYLDGKSMAELSDETLDLLIEIASGRPSVGERAGHAQVQLWRNWQQRDASQLPLLLQQPTPTGEPISLATSLPASGARLERLSHDPIALILPTSLCSGQIAERIAQQLTTKAIGKEQGIERFVALTHTEGCGVSGDGLLQSRTLLNYVRHSRVRAALLLEHGCEKTHNDFMRNLFDDLGLKASEVGWASIQLDGGIDRVSAKVEQWFVAELANQERQLPAEDQPLRLGLYAAGPLPAASARLLAEICQQIVAQSGSVVVPDNASLVSDHAFAEALAAKQALSASLAYGDYAEQAGFHIMHSPTSHWVETLTGLGATGVDLVLAHVSEHPLQTHPFIPVVQLCSDPSLAHRFATSLDVLVSDATQAADLMAVLKAMLAGQQRPGLYGHNSAFQMTRGQLGISL